MKSYFTPRLFWRSHQLPHRFEDRGNLFIVLPTRDSSSANFFASSLFVSSVSRSFTNTRMIAILTFMARSLLSTLESIATPSSVNARTCSKI